jgi:cytochrome c-type biogenesis protein CcmH/NrfG
MTFSSASSSRDLNALARWVLLVGLVAIAVIPDEAILRPKMVWGRGLILIAISIAVGSAALAGRLDLRWKAFLLVALLPALLAGIRLLLGTVDSEALARDEIGRLALLPAVAWIAAVLLDGPRWRRRFVVALALAGIWVGGYAVLQRLGGLFPVGVVPAIRAEAGFGNPVFLGAWLVLVTPLLLAEALVEPGWSRWCAALAAGLCLPALLGTGTAGAWLGMAVAILVGVLLVVPSSRTLHVTLVLGGVALAALILLHPDVLLRPRTHGLIWRDTVGMILQEPWGVGPGQFQVAFLPFASEDLLAAHPRSSVIINDAHSEPLQLVAELGWVGLLVMLWVVSALVTCVRRVLGAPAERAKDGLRLVAALAGVSGCLAQSLVSPDLRFHVTTIMLGLLLGLAASFDDAEAVTLRGGKPLRAGLALLALLGLTGTAWGAWDTLSMTRQLTPTPPLEVTPADAIRLAKLREDVNSFPDDAGAHYDLATALASQRRYAEAAAVMRKAQSLAPGNPSVVRSLGVLEAMAGRFDAAFPLLEAALVEAPDDLDVRYLLAFCAFGRGDVRTAIIQAEAVVKTDPDHARARVLLQRLRE